MGHKKTSTPWPRRDMRTLKLKFSCFIASAKFQNATAAFLHQTLGWAPRWKDNNLAEWGDWKKIFFEGVSNGCARGLWQRERGCWSVGLKYSGKRTRKGNKDKEWWWRRTTNWTTLLYWLGEWLWDWDWAGGFVGVLLYIQVDANSLVALSTEHFNSPLVKHWFPS